MMTELLSLQRPLEVLEPITLLSSGPLAKGVQEETELEEVWVEQKGLLGARVIDLETR